MKASEAPPGADEFELTLFGPGYGESIVLHLGNGVWALIDSCLNEDGEPRALRYLESIGLDPARDVALIVATHWHDDHIRGMAQLVEHCTRATFCCASALAQMEFLAAVRAMEGRHLSSAGSGVRQMHEVFSRLGQRISGQTPRLALANRRIFDQGGCEIWSLSPNDRNYAAFIRTIGSLMPTEGQSKRRVPDPSPNEVAVVLWVRIENIVVLLGSDLERPGWIEILQSAERPTSKASAFKVPHHGSKNAHHPVVWTRMLEPNPFAVLTPWRRGGHALPTQSDVERILSCTPNAYATARESLSAKATIRRPKMVDRTMGESGIKLRRLAMSSDAIRLRRPLDGRTGWNVQKFGSACHLNDSSF